MRSSKGRGDRAREGITFLSTPFDLESVAVLDKRVPVVSRSPP